MTLTTSPYGKKYNFRTDKCEINLIGYLHQHVCSQVVHADDQGQGRREGREHMIFQVVPEASVVGLGRVRMTLAVPPHHTYVEEVSAGQPHVRPHVRDVRVNLEGRQGSP